MFFRFVHPEGTRKDGPAHIDHFSSESDINRNRNQRFQHLISGANRSNSNNLHSNFKLQANKNYSSERKLPNVQNPERIISNQMKALLTQSYQKQIKQKKQQRLASNRLKIMEEKDYLSHFQNHKQFQKRRNQNIRQQFKKQILTEIKEKSIVVNLIKTQQTQIQRIFQQPRQYSLRNKQLAFKKFYQEAGKNQKIVEDQYKNYMRLEEGYIRGRNKHKISQYQQNFDLMRKHRQQDLRLHSLKQKQLRNILDTQIKAKQKRHNKNMAVQSFKKSGSLKSIYHPIINPIDFKMDVNNKYVIKQLVKRAKNNQG